MAEAQPDPALVEDAAAMRIEELLGREGPLEYERAVYYKCKKKAPRWISRSIMNPGRRYSASINRRVGALPPVRELNLVFFRFNQNVECRSDYYRRADAISGSGMMKTALPHL